LRLLYDDWREIRIHSLSKPLPRNRKHWISAIMRSIAWSLLVHRQIWFKAIRNRVRSGRQNFLGGQVAVQISNLVIYEVEKSGIRRQHNSTWWANRLL
jgi:hypothetical protein